MSGTEATSCARGLVVGVGASAGGLEAFTTFLAHVPSDSGMAFVLVQHLSPDHESMLTEILDRVAAIPVVEAQEGMRAEPNRVHVIPPDATLTIKDGWLHVAKPAPRAPAADPSIPSSPHSPPTRANMQFVSSCQVWAATGL